MKKHFIGRTLDRAIIKLEKYVDGKKVDECGFDNQENFDIWGHQSPLREEYEQWVSKGGLPEYIEDESLRDMINKND